MAAQRKLYYERSVIPLTLKSQLTKSAQNKVWCGYSGREYECVWRQTGTLVARDIGESDLKISRIKTELLEFDYKNE